MVAMSGGVDSSVTAFLVLQQGFSALGATMRLINNYDPSPDKARACGAETDIADAKAVCARLGCPHEVLDLPNRSATKSWSGLRKPMKRA